MKKTLLSLALFGAFSGAAMAADNVQLYGIVDLGVEHLTFNNQSVNRLGSGIQSGSRIGLKGTEDLGGGLKAVFQLETGFCANGNTANPYTGTSTSQGAQFNAGTSYCTGGQFMGRTSMVGLAGDFGTVVGGRIYSPYFNTLAAADPFGAGLTGSLTNLDQAALTYVRVSQAAAYITPNFSGFQGTLAYLFGGQPGDSSNGRAYSAALTYNNGPISAGGSYTNHNLTTGPGSSYVTNKLWNIYGSYDFGIAKVAAYYSDAKWGLPGIQEVAAGTQNSEWKTWMLGATVPVGPGAVLASYARTKDANLSNTTAKQYAIGYTYALSKRTNLYTSYSHITNDSNVDYFVGDATVAGNGSLGGQSSSGFALGIRHQF